MDRKENSKRKGVINEMKNNEDRRTKERKQQIDIVQSPDVSDTN